MRIWKKSDQKCVGEKIRRRNYEAIKMRCVSSNWFKLVMKMTKVEYGKIFLLKGVKVRGKLK